MPDTVRLDDFLAARELWRWQRQMQGQPTGDDPGSARHAEDHQHHSPTANGTGFIRGRCAHAASLVHALSRATTARRPQHHEGRSATAPKRLLNGEAAGDGRRQRARMPPRSALRRRARLGRDLVIGSLSFGVQARAVGFRQLYRWLAERHFGLIVVADRHEPLLVIRFGNFLRKCSFRESTQTPRPKMSQRVSDASKDGESI